uniref:Uncharacterized protein n=1 Tax=Romanomermis culicivorax TaxID=13658 RepID=A0A915JGH1_ROMCU
MSVYAPKAENIGKAVPPPLNAVVPYWLLIGVFGDDIGILECKEGPSIFFAENLSQGRSNPSEIVSESETRLCFFNQYFVCNIYMMM